MTQSVKDVLVKARELISTPDRWTKEAGARDVRGTSLDSCTDRSAVCWCSAAALDVAAISTGWTDWRFHDLEETPEGFLCRAISSGYTALGLINWNDAPERTHDEVLAAFDRAIALASAQEAQP